MFTKQVNELASWIERALQLQIEEVNSFIGGITRDLEAVENAIALQYSEWPRGRECQQTESYKADHVWTKQFYTITQ